MTTDNQSETTLSESFPERTDTPERASSNNGQSLAADLTELSSELEEFLQYAACLEKEVFNERMLECALLGCSVNNLVAEAVERSFLVAVEEDTIPDGYGCSCSYRFSNVMLRNQVYQSIPNKKRGELHVAIAHRLWKGEYEEAFVLHHFMRGESFILQGHKAAEHTVKIASLCLSEGKKAVRASDFRTATSYLNFGVRLLQNMRACWKDEYQLSLELYRASAEANYCDSKFDQAQISIDAVIENARCFRDTLGIRSTEIYVLGSLGKRQEALAVGLDVLRKLGEPITANPWKAHVVSSFIRVRHMLRNKSNESIMRLPRMENEEKIAAMQILNLIFSHAISSKQIMVPLLVFRSVKLTVQHGLSVMSSVAFANYAMVLCNLKYYDSGYRYSKLALALYDRFPIQEWLPRVYLGVYAGVYGGLENLERTVQPVKYACHVGLETGDIEVALLEAYIYATNLFVLGRPLAVVEQVLLEYHQETIIRKQFWLKNRFALFSQLVQNLMRPGGSDPTTMIGNMFNEEARKKICKNDYMSHHVFHMCKMILCYLFADYDTAVQESRLASGLIQSAPSRSVVFSLLPWFAGLSLVAQMRQKSRSSSARVNRMIRRKIRHLKEYAMRCPSLCSGKLFLLQAEMAWLLGKHNDAFFKYSCAISTSSASGVPFDLALANECAGRFHLYRGDKDEASARFKDAQELYKEWGAHVKAEHLAEEMVKLLS